jgi:hypothetical protein
MDYAKLLFAAEVRRLAQEIRVNKRQIHLMKLPTPHDPKVEVEAFDAQHPFSHFLQIAYRELTDAAAFIDSMDR